MAPRGAHAIGDELCSDIDSKFIGILERPHRSPYGKRNAAFFDRSLKGRLVCGRGTPYKRSGASAQGRGSVVKKFNLPGRVLLLSFALALSANLASAKTVVKKPPPVCKHHYACKR